MRIFLVQKKIIGKIVIIFFVVIILGFFIKHHKEAITTVKDFRTIFEGRTDIKNIALTFNVDWGEESIPPLLDILKKENVKATFFITGRWAQKNPQLVCDIAKAGHEIGNHGYYHKYHERLSFEESLQEIKDTEMVIYNLTKKRTILFAPPYGEKGEAVIKSAYAAGYRTVFWTIDTIDWRKPAPEYIVSRVKNKGLTNGSIILMHPTEPTVLALPEIIKYAKTNGFDLRTVSEIAGGY